MKGELVDMGEETDENVENISKMQGQILKMTGGKVNIFDENGDFRSTYDIMVDIASIYDKLSSTDQADLLETIAGKHRANDVAALIQNIGNAVEMEEAAMNSAGSAAEENAKRVDSLQGRLNQLTTVFQSLSNSAMDSDFLKGAVSGVTTFIDTIGKLIDTVGLLPTLAGIAAAALSFKGVGITSIDKQTNSLKLFGKTVEEVKDTVSSFNLGNLDKIFGDKFGESWSGFGTQIDKDVKCINNLQNALMNGVPAGEAFENCMKGASDSIRELAESPDFINAFTEKNTEAMNAQNAIIEENIQKRKQSQVAMMAENKSLGNVAQLIAEYNSGCDKMGKTCQRTGMTQAQFASAVGQSNNVLGKQLSGLNGASASMTGYIARLIGAKAATIGLQAASLALNAALTMVIGVAISAAVSAIDNWIHRNERLKESVEDATSSYKEQHNSLIKSKSDFQSAAESYEKLSKGVDSLTNKNISLMPEEYEEYISAANQIADMVPSLVAGYDSQGNAILDCAGDVNTLTDAYNDLIIAENNKLLNGDGEDYKGLSDILDDFQNDYDSLQDQGWFYEKNTLDTADALEGILGLPEIDKASVGEYVRNLSEDAKTGFTNIGRTLKDEMKNQNLSLDGMEAPDDIWGNTYQWAEYVARVCDEYPKVARAAIQNMNSELDGVAQESRDAMSTYLENVFLSDNYKNIDDKMQSILTSVIGNIDGSTIKSIIGDKTGDEAKAALTGWVDNLLSSFDGLDSGVQDKLTSAFDLSDMFANGEMSFGEYKKQIEEVNSLIDGLNIGDEVKSQLKLSLNIDEVQDQYDTIYNRLTSDEFSIKMDDSEARKFIDGLSSSEVSVAVNMIQNGEIKANINAEELKKQIENAAKIQEALSFTINIEGETERIDAVNAALKESVSAAGLSVESLESVKNMYADLDGYDPSKLFEKTSQGIRLNREEVNKLEKEIAETNLEDVGNSIDEVTKAYEDVTEKIRTCNNEAERITLLNEQASYADKIAELEEMQAQYEGLTSAYNKWIKAQEGGEEGDVYDNAESMFEDAEELYKKGLVGTNEFAAATEFLTGKDTSDMSPSEIAAEWENAADKMERYFTKDEEGNQTSDGVSNLLTDISKLNEEWAHLNESGEWDIDMDADDVKKAAEDLGVSAELIEAVLGKGSDYGLDINYDSVYEASKSLETMRNEAESANAKLIELGYTDVTFSFESNNIDDLNTQIGKAQATLDKFKNEDGTVNIKAEGAKEAQAVLAALISQKQKVSEPDFMKVSVATIGDEKLGSVIQAMQTIQTYKNIYDINVAIGADTSDAQAKIGETITKIQSLKNENPQVFADLGLDTTEFNNALSTLSGNVKAGVELDQSALSTVQSSLQGVNATVLANVGVGDTSALNGLSGSASITPTPTTTDLGGVFTGTAMIVPSPSTTDMGSGFTGSGQTDMTPKTKDMGSDFTGSGTVSMSAGSKWLGDDFTGSGTVTITVNKQLGTDNTSDKVPEANGTAHANGSAFADGTKKNRHKSGDWSIGSSGVALGGELGQELVVRDGKFFTIGDNGAEFFQHKPGDIIFNHLQTEELFKNGYVTGGGGRGRAIVGGTAFIEGSAFATGVYGGGKLWGSSSSGGGTTVNNTYNYNYNSSGSSSSKSSSSKSSSNNSSSSKANEEAEEFEETLDWIEIAIDRVERAISRLDLKASSVFKRWGVRNNALVDQIGEVRNEIDLQQRAYNRYIQQANSVGLDEGYASKVRDGTIDIQTITDEDLNDKISEYREWYEKALDCKDAIDELRETESELYKQRFDNVASEYDGILGLIEHEKNLLDEFISQSEAQAYLVSTKYYEALAKNERETIDQLQDKKNDLIASLGEALASGTIEENSEAYVEMLTQINEVTEAIEESNTALLEYAQTIQELEWEQFDVLQERIEHITEESEFLIELMNNKKLYDDKGQFTDEGMATMGLHGVNYNTNMHKADMYGAQAEIEKSKWEADPNDRDAEQRYYELIELQREHILAAEDEKNAIRDLVEEGIELELDALQELIDKREEELDASKD